MPIFGLRFKDGLPLRDGTNPSQQAFEHADIAKHILYPPGKYNVTPSDYLWPAAIQLLAVSASDNDKTTGLLQTLPVDKDARMFFTRKAEDLWDESNLLRTTQHLITERTPAILAKPDQQENGEIITLLLLFLYSAQGALFNEFESPVAAEPRRDIVSDVQKIIAKQKNGRISEDKLIDILIAMDPFYKKRRRTTFRGVLNELVQFGHVARTTKSSPTIYFLK